MNYKSSNSKLKTFYLVIFLLLINFSNNIPSESQTQILDKNLIESQYFDQSLNYSSIDNLIIEISNSLFSYAEKFDNKTKFSQYVNKVDDDILELDYFSSQRGLSGIGQSLFQLYKQTSNQTYYDLLINLANYLESIMTEEGYSIKWNKEEGVNQFWTSYRYGNTGIIPFLLDLYDLTSNNKYLKYAERAGNWLIEKSINNGSDIVYWLTSGDTGFTSTDYYYGGAGIIDSLLKIYSKTKNNTFLEYSLKGANWLILNKVVTNESNNAGFIPWTTLNISFFKGIVYSGLQNGIAGIGKVLLNLYIQTNDEYWLDQSKNLGYWLQSIDFNDTGLYPNGGAPYITGLYEGAPYILSYGAGSLGIAEFYFQLYFHDQKEGWLHEIIRITSTIDEVIASDYNKLLPQQLNTSSYYFGLQSGLAGVIKVYSQLVKYFNQTEHWITLNSVIDSLKKYSNEFNGKIPENLKWELISTNRENGLAGILESLAYILDLKQNFNAKYEIDYSNAIDTLPNPKITYLNSAQTNISYEFLILTFIIIVIFRKKYNK